MYVDTHIAQNITCSILKLLKVFPPSSLSYFVHFVIYFTKLLGFYNERVNIRDKSWQN